MLTHVARLPYDATLKDATEALLRTRQQEFPVVDSADRVLGILTRSDMIAAFREHGPETPIVDVMHPDVPLVRPDDPFDEAFRIMQESNCPALPVVDRLGRFVGLITMENVGELMLINSLRPPDGRPAWRMARHG